MNIQDYISSGTLELYAMGALNPEETAEVEKIIAQYPEVAQEMTRIEATLEDFAKGLEKFPRPNMKARIIAALADTEEGQNKSIIDNKDKEGVVRNLYEPVQSSYLKYAAVAGFAILLVSNIIFFMKWQNAEKALSDTIAQNYRLAENYKLTKSIEEKALADFSIASNHNFKVVTLKALTIAPTASAFIYWNAATQETFIDVRNLPTPAPDKQYQLWALVDGKPVDAGVFNLTGENGGLQKVKNVQTAQAFAVTLEKKGGSPAPTMTAMYLMAQI